MLSDTAGFLRKLVDDTRNSTINWTDRLIVFRKLIESGKLSTLVPLLPLLLNLKGKPYNLNKHFPFESFFRNRMPTNTVVKAARQVSKSTSLAAKQILAANSIANFNTLTITPLFEQVRRFSSNYVGPFINTSPVKSLWINTATVNSVLQRSFRNNSQLFFSFALLDADRVRGINADAVNIDEVQDMDQAHLPIIRECMSGSEDWGIFQFTGTPKTLDNTIQGLWLSSSQAEWAVPCFACNYLNIPAMSHDLDKMIGGYHEDISEERPGVICAKCGKPVFPRLGRWVHQYPERRWEFAGYHIPQVIMPMHYAKPDKWAILLGKRQGLGNTTVPMFYNEVLGESFDAGMKLVTQSELQEAGCLHENNEQIALTTIHLYDYRVLAVDWGGGGEDEVSFTTLAVMGIRGDGQIDVIYGKKLLTPHDHRAEAEECLRIFNTFKCHFMPNDYTGAGAARETIMVLKGLPLDRLIPIHLTRTANANFMYAVKPTERQSRIIYRLDKARSLLHTCQAIKIKLIRFFKYDHVNNDDPGLLHDFLALVENKIPTNHAGDIYTIQRNPMFSDDFAQAVNLGACCLWYITDKWPQLAEYAGAHLSANQAIAAGENVSNQMWYDDADIDMNGYLLMP